MGNFGPHIASQLNLYINNASYFMNRNEELNSENKKLTQESEAMKKKLDQLQSILATRDKALGEARRELGSSTREMELERHKASRYKADCETLKREISDKTTQINIGKWEVQQQKK